MTSRKQIRAFSLMELLVVMAIAITLISLTVPALTSTLQSISLTQGSRNFIDQLSQARQMATTRNRTVEIRFYSYKGADGKKSFRAMQSFEMLDNGKAIPLGAPLPLGNGVILDSSAQLSPLLGLPREKQWTTDDPKIDLPGIGSDYDTRKLRLRPDGTTDLDNSQPQWFATLHHENKGDGLTALPQNFCLLQIDPWTGRCQAYRP